MMDIAKKIQEEVKRQANTLMLIPSENYTYKEVQEAVGSVLMHKYSEGYPGKRYYQGNRIIDEIEQEAIDQAKFLFGTPHANVQPYSGSPANTAVYFGLLNPGDTIMGMSLAAGGHLTHGHPKITFSGKYFKSIQYGLNTQGYIDFDALHELAQSEKPKLIVAGLTAYPRILEWEKFAQIADSVGAILMADISHIAGLVAGGAHPSPVPHVHVVTTTTHKTLRGPRGAMIMVTDKGLALDPDMAKKIDRAVFPGLQGGPHDNQTAGIAIALQKASEAEFGEYATQVVKNAQALSAALVGYGFSLATGGTDNHLILVDVREKGTLGKPFAESLEEAGIVVNYNAIPNDPNPPMNPSGIRLGTPAVTVRGMKEKEMEKIASFINAVADSPQNAESVKAQVESLCSAFPITE